MLFGGLQKLTTLDFPGVVSALVFTQGCNFHCPYCHNAQLIPARGGEAGPDQETVLKFLRKRRDVLDGLVISGGEPLLQPDLESFCCAVKDMGYKVKLDTNGSFPDMLARIVNASLVDYVAIDVKTAPNAYATEICADATAGKKLAKSLELLANSAVAFEIRTTCFARFVEKAALLSAAAIVPPATPWFLQRGNVPASPGPAMPDRLSLDEEKALLAVLQEALPRHALAARAPFAQP